jgi:hypothetical protein
MVEQEITKEEYILFNINQYHISFTKERIFMFKPKKKKYEHFNPIT